MAQHRYGISLDVQTSGTGRISISCHTTGEHSVLYAALGLVTGRELGNSVQEFLKLARSGLMVLTNYRLRRWRLQQVEYKKFLKQFN